MDKVRYVKVLLGALGLVVGGWGVSLMYQINTSVSAASQAIASIKTNTDVVVSPSISFGEGKGAMISREFHSAIQACWYYQADYVSLHPYTVLWEQSGEEDYPKIRVVAEEGTWNAHTCRKENGKVKLIGNEAVTHRIEAKFKEETDYEHIATTRADYFSELSFDDKGRIDHRNIIKGKSEFIQPEKFPVKINECKSKVTNDEDLNYKNTIHITELIKQEGKYVKAIELYLCKRKDLHEDLTKYGCGAVPIEPEFVTTEKGVELEKPSIIFLCHKNGKKSHVRVMIRQGSTSDQKKSVL